MGYTDAVLVVGSDRTQEFSKLLNKYNGRDYNFDSIDVVSAGERDPDAEGVEGMSASKLRGLAKEGDFKTFASGLAKKLTSGDAKKIYDIIRNVIEQLEEVRKPLTIQQRLAIGRRMKVMAPKIARKRALKLRKMADKTQLTKRSQKAARKIIRKKVAGTRGLEYNKLSASEKITIDKLVAKKSAAIAKLAKRLMPKVTKAERERLKAMRSSKNEGFIIERREVPEDPSIKDREGSQPRKYHTGLAKSTKVTRDKQFKKGAEMSSDDPKAYPDKHAGDTGVKTKTSKHTKKYHDMFGEQGATKRARDSIEREKEADKRKHDAMLDRARTQDTQAKNRQESYELSEESMEALKKKSEKSGISYGILKKVYDRGMAAWRTGHRPGSSQQQWAYARVNSFITKGKGTWGKADADLAAKVRGSKPKSEDCWDGYKQVGMKKKGDKAVPNCVPESVELGEARAKKAVAGGKVQKLVTAFGQTYKGKKYDEIDLELVRIDNSSKIVTFRILHPAEHIGDEVKIPFKTLRLGRFMATDTSKINKEEGEVEESRGHKVISTALRNRQTRQSFATGKSRIPTPAERRAQIAKQQKKEKVTESRAARDARNAMRFDKDMMQKSFSDDDVATKQDKDDARKNLLVQLKKSIDTKGQHAVEFKDGKKVKLPMDLVKKAVVKYMSLRRPDDKLKLISNMSKSFKDMKKELGEAVSPAQQAAIAIAKKEKGEKPKNAEEKDVALQVNKKKKLDAILAVPKARPSTEPDQITESFQTTKNAGVGETMYASDFMKMVGAFEYHPSVVQEEGGAGEYGTDKLADKYKKDTPGQIAEDCDCDYSDLVITEAEYQGKTVNLNDPFRLPSGSNKKFGVYVKNSKGNVVVVKFGDPNMEIKRDDPERRKSFRARHDCANAKDKTTPRYWSCYQWRGSAKVDN
jgi:hypothetical protein